MERKRGREETEEEEEEEEEEEGGSAAPPAPAQRPAPFPPLPLPLPMLLQPLWLLTLPVQLPCVLDHECKYVATSALELSRHIWRHWHTAQLGHPIWYAWSDTPTAVGNGPLMGPACAGGGALPGEADPPSGALGSDLDSVTSAQSWGAVAAQPSPDNP